MAGRRKHNSIEELIDKAIDVFWCKGFSNASTEELMEEMGIGQGSFYRSFPGGKKELYQKSLKRFSELSIDRFIQELEQSEEPITYIKDFFRSIIERPLLEVDRGCYFGNSVMEFSFIDEVTKSISIDILNKWQDSLEKAIEKAKLNGIISSGKSSKTIAGHLVNLWNGINITHRANPDKKLLREILELNLEILD